MPEFGFPHLHYRVVDSTNERARELAVAGAPAGTVVTADEQTAGRGRHGRAWSAPPGSALLYSAILRPLGAEHALLPLVAAVAVCEAVESVAPIECAIKWPNDIWVEERKLAGILIEARPLEWAVIGIGINVGLRPDHLPADLRWPATSLAIAAPGREPAVAPVRDAVSAALSRWVAAPAEAVLAAYRDRDALRGRALAWSGAGRREGAGEGVAAGIDARGNLVVERPDGERLSLGSGEVTLRLSR